MRSIQTDTTDNNKHSFTWCQKAAIAHHHVVWFQEFAGEDSADLFLEERETALRQAQEEKHKLQMSVPGILNPHEIPEEMCEWAPVQFYTLERKKSFCKEVQWGKQRRWTKMDGCLSNKSMPILSLISPAPRHDSSHSVATPWFYITMFYIEGTLTV